MEIDILQNIALTLIPDVGPVTSKLLISYCGSAEAVFKASKKELSKIPQIGLKTAERVVNCGDVFAAAEAQMRFISDNGGRVVTFHSKDYPKRLKHFENSPLVLYARGEMDLNHSRTVAIIGTRTPTELGKIQCEKLVQELKSYNVQIISGLALGIDTCAHSWAVKSEIETIGVLGHGLDRLYPSANKKLAGDMVKNGGILTEFPTETNPDRENFPMRNRIIAGMSDVVVVIESKKRGGSIITAEFANSYNKDVFALPGRVSDTKSEGCNRLIKQHKANLLESAKDIAYIMRWEEEDKHISVQKSLFVELSESEKAVVDIIQSEGEITIDDLNFSLKLSPSQLASMLLNLEFKGVIRSLPGKKYILA